MKRLLSLILIVYANLFNAQNKIVSLWDDKIPNYQKSNQKEIIEQNDVIRIFNVSKPTLEIFVPARKNINGKAVIICPGGGYKHLSYDWEGTDVAKWFNSKGITAFVLKYRLPQSESVITSYEAPLQDAQRALRWARFHAKDYNIQENQIGIMGFSAGGHLASTLGTRFDTPNNFIEESIDTISARPDFMILVYPVITMNQDFAHKGSRANLLGKNPTEKQMKLYSNDLQVTDNTPPTFIVHSTDDKSVPVENSLAFYKALKDNNVNSEMHVYPHGGHGYGLALGKDYLQSWTDRLKDWLEKL